MLADAPIGAWVASLSTPSPRAVLSTVTRGIMGYREDTLIPKRQHPLGNSQLSKCISADKPSDR
jgi:hypothetical protein